MRGILRSIEDDIHFEINQAITKIGKENCDINIIVSTYTILLLRCNI